MFMLIMMALPCCCLDSWTPDAVMHQLSKQHVLCQGPPFVEFVLVRELTILLCKLTEIWDNTMILYF
jgi:hypothetical protein